MRTRTTLTLDPDVSRELESLREERSESFRAVVNQALRLGVQEMRAPRKRKVGETRPVSGTGPRLHNFDDISEVLSLVEGDNYK